MTSSIPSGAGGAPARAQSATGCVALADGSVFWGRGFGAVGETVGELCFNTAMTGYQEVMTDPSYAGQVLAFTFPHIGNVGATPEDEETANPVALGVITRMDVTAPSNWRSTEAFPDWLARHGRVGVSGIDTRRLTRRIRDLGMPHVAVAHAPQGGIDAAALVARAQAWNGIEGADLAKGVSCKAPYRWSEARWRWGEGFTPAAAPQFRVAAVDFGAKRNILRCLADVGCEVTVLPADASAADVLEAGPDGVFLSNGPGDPAATGAYAVPMIRAVLDAGRPMFGICLGHQMLALALGGQTKKMNHGHHGANHPVKDLETNKVEITSMNHGFTVDADTLPAGVKQTHVSLFDGTNCGLRVENAPVFSVQYHPEASPGPRDSFYLFERFAQMMAARRVSA